MSGASSVPRLLAISGALRKSSTNAMLLREAGRLFGECVFEEADLNMPLYDGDLEESDGLPDSVTRLADQIEAADAVLISTPEYNKGPSGVLKNALDWVSRTSHNPWDAKPVAVMSAAAGRSGGERAQMVLRSYMIPFRALVVSGPEMHLAASSKQFDDNGHLTSQIYVDTLTDLMKRLRTTIDAF